MAAFVKGDVVVVPFPFSDLTNAKRRPALVLAELTKNDYLKQHYLPNLSSYLVSEHHIDPLHFRDELNSYKGTAFSVEPTLFQSAWFRPHNMSEDIPNLYCVGAGTHPGAGLPGVMSSGKIVAEIIGRAG